MKKFTAILLLLSIITLMFSSCGASRKTVISLDNNEAITADIFSYYLKKAMGETDGLTEQNYLDTATNECIKYTAVNNFFKNYQMKLTPAQKAEITRTTNLLWQQYGDYYTELGLSKQTLYKIQTTEQYKESIRFYLYDTGGSLAVDENQIKAMFNTLYVGFRFVYDYLYDTADNGETVKKSESEINEIYSHYVNAANAINNKGANLEEAYASFATDEAYNTLSLDTVVINENNSFPDGFYDSVREAENGQAIVVVADDYIYLVIRENILEDDTYYTEYRNECLIKLTDSMLANQLAAWTDNYNAVRKLANAKQCYKRILKTDKKTGDTNE